MGLRKSRISEHEPMPVGFTTEGNLTSPFPPLYQHWSPLDRLRWKAGVLEARTGLRVCIVTGDLYRVAGVPIPGMFGYASGRLGGGPRTYKEMWDFLTGVAIGAELAREADRRGGGDPPPAAGRGEDV